MSDLARYHYLRWNRDQCLWCDIRLEVGQASWRLDALFPDDLYKVYYEGAEWNGCSVQESVQTVNGRAKVYAGLMFGDIKDDFEKALDEAYGNGASGISFFAGPDEEYLRRFKAYLDKRGFIVK